MFRFRSGNNRGLKLLDLLAIASFLFGYENLLENRQQSKQNDVQAANDRQAKYMLDELAQKFEEQNKILTEILKVVKPNDGE